MEITMKFEQKYSITSLREDNHSLIKRRILCLFNL